MARKIEIYTDGSCRGNPGPGGWGVVVTNGVRTRELSGGESATTNNQMELTAALEALRFAKQTFEPGRTIILYTDSQYVRKGITEWMSGWKANGFKTAKKEPVKNKELWVELDALNSVLNVEWRWVKAHNGNVLNERADMLAKRAGYEAIAA